MSAIVVKLSLAVVLREFEDNLILKNSDKHFKSSKRVSSSFLDELLKQPFIFYVR